MFIEVDDGVVFVDEPNRAIAVLQLSDPIANRKPRTSASRVDTTTNRPDLRGPAFYFA